MPASHSPVLLPCLQSNALPSHVKISVSRQTLFEDSFQQVRGVLGLQSWAGVWGWPSRVGLALRSGASPSHGDTALLVPRS